MTLNIPLDRKTLQKLTDAANREEKSVSEWARDQLMEAVERELEDTVEIHKHLRKYHGAITDSSFEAPPRSDTAREVPAFD